MRQIASYALLGGIVIGTAPCSAATVDLTTHVNANLNNYHLGHVYPPNGGPIEIGGINFLLNALPGGGTGIVQTSADASSSFNIAVGEVGVTTVYTVINSAFGLFGALNGKLTFNGSLGAAMGAGNEHHQITVGQRALDVADPVRNSTVEDACGLR